MSAITVATIVSRRELMCAIPFGSPPVNKKGRPRREHQSPGRPAPIVDVHDRFCAYLTLGRN